MLPLPRWNHCQDICLHQGAQADLLVYCKFFTAVLCQKCCPSNLLVQLKYAQYTVYVGTNTYTNSTWQAPHDHSGKGKGEIVNVTASDGESASSSCNDGPRTDVSIGDEDFPTSSDEDDGSATGAANSKQLPPATTLPHPCPRGGHSDKHQVVCQSSGAESAIRGTLQRGGIIVEEHLWSSKEVRIYV